MKTLLSTILCAITISLFGQNQSSAGIFNLSISIDEEFVTTSSLGGFMTTIEEVPEEIVDSMRNLTVQMVSDYLDMPVELAYRGGKKSDMTGFSPFFELYGMPSQTLKRAIRDHDYRRYVQVIAEIAPAPRIVDAGNPNAKKKVKPMIKMTIKVFNKNKDVLDKRKSSLKNFGKMDTRKRRKSELLSPAKIYAMYRMALRAALIHS